MVSLGLVWLGLVYVVFNLVWFHMFPSLVLRWCLNYCGQVLFVGLVWVGSVRFGSVRFGLVRFGLIFVFLFCLKSMHGLEERGPRPPGGPTLLIGARCPVSA